LERKNLELRKVKLQALEQLFHVVE
jgi:hypothetical protein